jgi:hypothetical protein
MIGTRITIKVIQTENLEENINVMIEKMIITIRNHIKKGKKKRKRKKKGTKKKKKKNKIKKIKKTSKIGLKKMKEMKK